MPGAGAGTSGAAVGATAALVAQSNNKGQVVVPVKDSTATLTPAASNRVPEPPAAGYSPAAVKKWEEQLQATLFRKMSLQEIRSSTGNFNKRYYEGEGAFAVVYRGRSPNGVPWAVKRSKQNLMEGSTGEQDFEKEVIAISRLSHKNLVRLLGYCMEGGEHILVYEYCPNGSLSSALYNSTPQLDFLQRLNIAIGTAEALYYLHSASSPPIIHRDVKPDNVFLDSQMQAKLGDFGLLKKLLENSSSQKDSSGPLPEQDVDLDAAPPKQNESVYTRIAGTPGYLDPEYHLTSKVTAKGDVYSFGVLLLQLCTGQRAILPQHPKFNLDDESLLQRRPSAGHAADSGAGASGRENTSSKYSEQTESTLGDIQADRPRSAAGSRGGSSRGIRPSSEVAASAAPSNASGLAPSLANPEYVEGEVLPGEPIHISTWLVPHVRSKVVEPVADLRFGNNYNKTAMFRMLEIGLLCVQPIARKRPAMSAVTRWLHEVKEELDRAVEEAEGAYSSVVFDRRASDGTWRGLEDESSLADSQWNVETQNPIPGFDNKDSQAASSFMSGTSSYVEGSVVIESARMTEGR